MPEHRYVLFYVCVCGWLVKYEAKIGLKFTAIFSSKLNFGF